MTIGIIWINHHVMISRLREADHTVLTLNLLLLMRIVVLPFAIREMSRERRRLIVRRSTAGLGPYVVASSVAYPSACAAVAVIGALFYALPIASVPDL